MKSKRISKAEHVERMGERAMRRARDAGNTQIHPRDVTAMAAAVSARRKNGVGRPPRKA